MIALNILHEEAGYLIATPASNSAWWHMELLRSSVALYSAESKQYRLEGERNEWFMHQYDRMKFTLGARDYSTELAGWEKLYDFSTKVEESPFHKIPLQIFEIALACEPPVEQAIAMMDRAYQPRRSLVLAIEIEGFLGFISIRERRFFLACLNHNDLWIPEVGQRLIHAHFNCLPPHEGRLEKRPVGEIVAVVGRTKLWQPKILVDQELLGALEQGASRFIPQDD